MFKKIVGFGDSWMRGDELVDPSSSGSPHEIHLQDTAYREGNCFLGLVASHYGVESENFGISGGSLQSAIWTFLYWLEHEPNPEQCLVLHGITNSYRFSYYNPKHTVYPNDPPWNRYVHSTWSDFAPAEFRPLIKQQTVLTDSHEIRTLNYQQALMLFDGVSARRNIGMCQFNIFPDYRVNNVPTLVWPEEDLQHWILQHQGKNLLKPHKHPNESGHRLIADRLINYIESAIIVA